MARLVYVSAPPASSVTGTAGQRAHVKVPAERTRESRLIPETSADTPVRSQGPGGSLPGPAAGHPLHGAGRHCEFPADTWARTRAPSSGVSFVNGGHVGTTRSTLCRVGRPARVWNGTMIPYKTNWSCVAYTILYQRGVIDISRRAGSPLWSIQPPPDMHLLKDPQEDTTLCGHRWAPGDTIEYSPIDGESIECVDCKSAISRS